MRKALVRWSAAFCSVLMALVLTSGPALAEPVDTTPPMVAITAPGPLVNTTTVNVTWEGSDLDSGISHYNVSMDGEAEVEVIGTFLVLTKLDQGEHEVVVTAFDNAGNHASHNLTFNVDSRRPGVFTFPEGTQVEVTSSIGAFFNEPMDRPSVVLTFDGSIVPVSWYGNIDGSCGCYWLPYSHLEYATQHNATITGQDLAGNAIDISWSFWTISYGIITGVVVDEDENPICDAQVMPNIGWNSRTTEYGSFAITMLPPGNYLIEIFKAGYNTITINVTVGTLEHVNLGNITLTKVPPPPQEPEQPLPDFTWLLIAAVLIGLVLVTIPFYVKRKWR